MTRLRRIMLDSICLLLVYFANISESYKDGAPAIACRTMIPLHLGNPLYNPSPYTISTTQDTYKDGDLIEILIHSPSLKLPFKGFLVQAKDSSNNIVGSFEASKDVRLMNCSSGISNSVTHVDDTNKQKLLLHWRVPDSFRDSVRFSLTVARNYRSYWVDELSKDLTYNYTSSE